MADCELQVGDVVLYRHKRNGIDWFDGAIGVVQAASDQSNIRVNWISGARLEQLDRAFPGGRFVHYSYNLQKVGHIEVGDGRA